MSAFLFIDLETTSSKYSEPEYRCFNTADFLFLKLIYTFSFLFISFLICFSFLSFCFFHLFFFNYGRGGGGIVKVGERGGVAGGVGVEWDRR